jgi:hypothetical protein
VTTAQELIAALERRRLLKRGRADEPAGMPEGWQRWFESQPAADAGAARARVEAWVAPLAQRLTYAAEARATQLGLPFFHLQRLARPHDPRDERALRIGVGTVDILLHVVLAALLLWLMYLRLMAMAQQQDDPGQVVQVEFIGRGNAETGGGAMASAGAPASAPTRSTVPRQATPAAASPPAEVSPPAPDLAPAALAPPTPIDASRPVPALAEAPTLSRQVLQVSEVPQPQPGEFRLPPPRERSVALPQAALREVQPKQQVEAVPQLDAPRVRTLSQAPPQLALRTPELKEQVRELEVFQPDSALVARERAAPAPRTPAVQVPQLRGEMRALPLRPEEGGGAPAKAAQGTVPGQAALAAGGGQAATGTGQGARSAPADGRGVAAAGKGAGPALKPAPGGWPGAAKSDDWGASSRNVAGTGTGQGARDGNGGNGKPGLFNGDGSVRLPDEWSKQDGLDLDRAGTWLQRPGLEYRGTRFDKYWIPQGNLLQEWVRRGIKELSIPIPGTGLKLKCVVSLLQFGGGCMPVDPDANEQSSTGRAAPDIPFKPALQEDNGSVRPAPPPPSKPTP